MKFVSLFLITGFSQTSQGVRNNPNFLIIAMYKGKELNNLHINLFVGKRYAMAICKTILAYCIRELEFTSEADQKLKLKLDCTLRPASGHLVQVHLREPSLKQHFHRNIFMCENIIIMFVQQNYLAYKSSHKLNNKNDSEGYIDGRLNS